MSMLGVKKTNEELVAQLKQFVADCRASNCSVAAGFSDGKHIWAGAESNGADAAQVLEYTSYIFVRSAKFGVADA